MAGWDCDAGEGPQISGKPGVRAPRPAGPGYQPGAPRRGWRSLVSRGLSDVAEGAEGPPMKHRCASLGAPPALELRAGPAPPVRDPLCPRSF